MLYGQNLAMNHLIATKQISIIKLNELIDFPSTNSQGIFSKLHIHIYHTDDLFSKFKFKAGGYDNITLPVSDTHLVKYYCLSMALESKRLNLSELHQMLINVTAKKIL